MIKIAPSILSADFADLKRDIQRTSTADYLHVDVMDGAFVPNITIGMPVVKSIRSCTDMFLDVHLMIDKPVRYAEAFARAVSYTHLHSGDAVKVVKRVGTLKSAYLLYLDHQPNEIIHLGIAQDEVGGWYPESLLVLQRNVTAYIDGQIPLEIVDFKVE